MGNYKKQGLFITANNTEYKVHTNYSKLTNQLGLKCLRVSHKVITNPDYPTSNNVIPLVNIIKYIPINSITEVTFY